VACDGTAGLVFRFPSHTQAVVSTSFGEQVGGGGGGGGRGPLGQRQGQLVLVRVKKMGKIATGKVYNKLVLGGFKGCLRPLYYFLKNS